MLRRPVKRGSATWPKIRSTGGSSRPTAAYHIQPKIDLHQIDSGPTGRLGPKMETSRCGPKTTKKSISPKPTRPDGAVRQQPPAEIAQIDSGDRREPGAVPLVGRSGATAPQDGPKRPPPRGNRAPLPAAGKWMVAQPFPAGLVPQQRQRRSLPRNQGCATGRRQ